MREIKFFNEFLYYLLEDNALLFYDGEQISKETLIRVQWKTSRAIKEFKSIKKSLKKEISNYSYERRINQINLFILLDSITWL